MIKSLLARIRQGYHTLPYPDGAPPTLPDRFRGCPVIDPACCDDCGACREVCPTDAIGLSERKTIDMGKCLFCGACEAVCGRHAITFSRDYRLSVNRRDDLRVAGLNDWVRATSLGDALRRTLGRSLQLRQVCAGGCGACEADVNVLGTIGWDLGRFGIQFVASPRHADGLLITGPVTENMSLALQKTYDAVPDPKIVIVVGACAISGGPYADHPEQKNGVQDILPIDLYVPGCPPHPLTILDGLLRLLHPDHEQKPEGLAQPN